MWVETRAYPHSSPNVGPSVSGDPRSRGRSLRTSPTDASCWMMIPSRQPMSSSPALLLLAIVGFARSLPSSILCLHSFDAGGDLLCRHILCHLCPCFAPSGPFLLALLPILHRRGPGPLGCRGGDPSACSSRPSMVRWQCRWRPAPQLPLVVVVAVLLLLLVLHWGRQ